jgi:alkylated DNA repair dioxygenase AlkB
MSSSQQSLFPESSPTFPEGFLYCTEGISEEKEEKLVAEIVALPFREFQFHGFQGKRRVVSFGWRYDFSEHRPLPADPIPDFLVETWRNVQTSCGFPFPGLQQVLVSEYAPGAPIGWHKDKPEFGNVMGLSLVSSCVFRLRKREKDRKWQRASLHLEPRSAYLLAGPARWEWEHSIPPVERLRYSITFRDLRQSEKSAASRTMQRTNSE